MPNIRKVLEIYVEHLPVELAGALDEVDGLDVAEHGSGWFMHVPNHRSAMHPGCWEYPPEIATVLSYALGVDCDWVLFHADADVDDHLPLYDWT